MTVATLSLNSSKLKFRLAGGAQPLIFLPVKVNDRGPFEFILDTGAGTSLLSTELAKQLEIVHHEAISAGVPHGLLQSKADDPVRIAGM